MKKHASTNISASVMDQIKTGKVHMRPRSYYTLLGIVSIGAVVLTGVTMTYVSSIVFFWLRIITADTMAYGARANLQESIASFPWWALIVALFLLAIAVVLVRKHSRMYKHKTSSIVLAILTCSLLLGFALSLLEIGAPHTPNSTNKPPQGQGRHYNLMK